MVVAAFCAKCLEAKNLDGDKHMYTHTHIRIMKHTHACTGGYIHMSPTQKMSAMRTLHYHCPPVQGPLAELIGDRYITMHHMHSSIYELFIV